MPVYNERATLDEIVQRVRAVDLTVDKEGDNPLIRGPLTLEREIIIVDDGSTDGTRAILEEWQQAQPDDMRIVFHARNGGKGAALRTGFQHATGDLLVI
ncbi:MAG: glycosyltransferase family 2 protein, partial [Caldilineaceae bacterium]|nr:glycosyltransferase family 2 protein [Caldilineaceae bacterium]